ncbi:hypothetical protein CDV31_016998, partial [Fusarium ambrosium]
VTSEPPLEVGAGRAKAQSVSSAANGDDEEPGSNTDGATDNMAEALMGSGTSPPNAIRL